MTNEENNGRKIVVPGETIVEGLNFLPGEGTYREKDNIRSTILGTVYMKGRLAKVIPLSGRYMPKEGDMIIGIVQEVRYNAWSIDINAPYDASLFVAEASNSYIDLKKDSLKKYFDIGDALICRIKSVDDNMSVIVSAKGPRLRKLNEGRLIDVRPSRIPRIIGRRGSMMRLLRDGTNCKIFVGQNGKVWLSGTPEGEAKAIKMIRYIEENAHTVGLTDRVKELLNEGGPKQKLPLSEKEEVKDELSEKLEKLDEKEKKGKKSSSKEKSKKTSKKKSKDKEGK